MRFITLLAAMIMASTAQAETINFSCSTPNDAFIGDMDGLLNVDGKISIKGEHAKIQYKGIFALGCEGDWRNGDKCWAETPEKYGRTSNQLPYNPRKYFDHMKFALDLNSDNAYGSFDLIFPKAKLIRGKEKFEAHMILTYINDHHGGTAHMECERIDEFQIPDNFVDLRECGKRVTAMASLVNICGDTADNFNAWNCKQEDLGKNITCRASSGIRGSQCVMDVEMGPMCERNVATTIIRDRREVMP